MADHSLDRQPGIDRLADDIKRHERMISELRTLQLQGNDAPNLNVVSSTGSLVLPSGAVSAFGFTLSSASGRRLGVFPMDFTLYEGSISAGNEIGAGLARDLDYLWGYRRDKATSDGFNVRDLVDITNFSGGTKTIWISITFRFLVAPTPRRAIRWGIIGL